MEKYPVRLTVLKKRQGIENHNRRPNESDLEELQYFTLKKNRICKIENEKCSQ